MLGGNKEIKSMLGSEKVLDCFSSNAYCFIFIKSKRSVQFAYNSVAPKLIG